jgi:hypothetical protein
MMLNKRITGCFFRSGILRTGWQLRPRKWAGIALKCESLPCHELACSGTPYWFIIPFIRVKDPCNALIINKTFFCL